MWYFTYIVISQEPVDFEVKNSPVFDTQSILTETQLKF